MIILVLGQPVQGMLKNGQIGGAVGSQFRRAQEGCLGAPVAGNFGDFLIIGRHNDSHGILRLEGRRDAIRYQRIACE